jgi:hypothetical protein
VERAADILCVEQSEFYLQAKLYVKTPLDRTVKRLGLNVEADESHHHSDDTFSDES